MNILALDSSSKAASCALIDEDQRLQGESYLDCGLTHSQTLLPMIESLCRHADQPLSGVDRIAVSVGPGSFTGLRIGIATAKSLAAALEIPCAGVSTLLSLAYNLRGFSGYCCAVLDARRSQVYYALFSLENGKVRRLTADAAVPLSKAIEQMADLKGSVYLVGDGADLCYNELVKLGRTGEIRPAPPALRLQRASSVAYAALQENVWKDAAEILPCYLRLSQAERERLLKQQEVHQ